MNDCLLHKSSLFSRLVSERPSFVGLQRIFLRTDLLACDRVRGNRQNRMNGTRDGTAPDLLSPSPVSSRTGGAAPTKAQKPDFESALF
jgi:hypothetical protein